MASTEGAAAGEIVRLAPSDGEALCPLCIEAGWNQVAADWRLMLELGQGFGKRSQDGRWIGSALALPLGPAVSWVSMVLVTEPERGKGLGTQLLARCLDAVAQSGRMAGLDATEFGRPIYLPLGFKDVFALSRWRWDAPSPVPIAPPPGLVVRPATPADLAGILAYDAPRSGFARGAILANLLARAAGFAHVALRDGTVAGFALGRDGWRWHHIGPVVADAESTGLALLSAAAAAIGGPLIVDIPDRHRLIRDWLEDRGARAPRRFMRMVRGAAEIGDAARVFALAGPELG
jgi:GNAT superfamily N-acetyltransferase